MTFNQWLESPIGQYTTRYIFATYGPIGANWFTIRNALRKEYERYKKDINAIVY